MEDRKKSDFISRVQDAFSDDLLNDPDAAVRAVFHLLQRHISHGEVVQVRNSMKKSLRDLWPEDCDHVPGSAKSGTQVGGRAC